MDLCTVAPKEKKLPTVFISGSGAAHHFSPVFEELRNKFGIGVSMLTTTGCDLDPLFYIKNKRGTCKSSNKNRISYIKNHAKEGDILFTGVSASGKFDFQTFNTPSLSHWYTDVICDLNVDKLIFWHSSSLQSPYHPTTVLYEFACCITAILLYPIEYVNCITRGL